MRIHINLASQPYELAREYKRRMTMLIAALGVIAAGLVGYIAYQRAHSRVIIRQMADVQRQMDALNHEETQARAILNRPANRVIADQSDFLNELFARKSMSWTHIFTVMEKIVPPELHVTSMKPEYSKTGDLVLHVVVATDSRARAIELVSNMEKSRHFRQAQVVAENVVTNTSEQGQSGSIQWDVAAIYIPSAAEEEDSPSADATPAPANSPAATSSPTPTPASMTKSVMPGSPMPMSPNAGIAPGTVPGPGAGPRPGPVAPHMRGH